MQNRLFVFLLFVSVLSRPTVAGDLLDDESRVQKIVSGCKFTEGPVVDAGGRFFFRTGRMIGSCGCRRTGSSTSSASRAGGRMG